MVELGLKAGTWKAAPPTERRLSSRRGTALAFNARVRRVSCFGVCHLAFAISALRSARRDNVDL